MAKTIHYLLILILLTLRSNAYAWSCSFNNDEDGWYQDGSMVCDGIEPQVALEEHYCTWYRPQDPVCQAFIEPICVDSIEYRTLSCPPNYQGGIQESRTYVCQQASWTNWSITSDNCTPNPPTCVASFDSRIVACPQGFDGQITETRISSCPDPYGTEVWSDWSESQNSCTQSTTSPISPISVTSPTNPVQSIVTESVTVPIIDVPQTNNPAEPTIESVVQEELAESSDEVESGTSDKADSTEEVKQDKQDGDKKESKDNVDNVVDDRKDIVHGFGLVLSMELFKQPMNFYQPPLEDPFSIIQEFPIEQRIIEEFYIDVFRQSNIENDYIDNSNRTWNRIRRSDILQ